MCIRCGEQETLAGRPYCIHCTFAVRAEVEAGLHELAEYLRAWAAFDAWCRDRGEPALLSSRSGGSSLDQAALRSSRGVARA